MSLLLVSIFLFSQHAASASNFTIEQVMRVITPREREIIQLLVEGSSNKEAASTLGISVKTIEAHRANIMRKLHLRSVSDLVRYAIRNKIVQP